MHETKSKTTHIDINEDLVSKSVSRMLLSLNNYKIDFIQNAVDLACFSKKTKAELRNTLKIPNNT